MTTVYIAGPMTGYADFNYPAFDQAERDLRAMGYDVLNPTSSEAENTTGAPQEWDWYMRRALRMVTQAHAIATLEGWQSSRGAVLEVQVANQLRMQTAPLEWWLSRGKEVAS